MGLALIMLTVRYDDGESDLYISNVWQKRMAHSGCNQKARDPAIILHNRHFEHSAIMAIAAGALLGQLFEG